MKKFFPILVSLFVGCVTPVDAPPITLSEVVMTARPGNFPDWATNANFAGGPDVGSPTKSPPGAGRIADGWRRNDVPPPAQQNWEMNLIGTWLHYLDERSQNWTVATNAAQASAFSTASVTYVGVTNANMDFNCQVGDILMLQFHAETVVAGGGLGAVQLLVTDSAGDHVIQQFSTGAANGFPTGFYKYTVLNASTNTVKLQAKTSSGGTTITMDGLTSMSGIQLRP